MKSLNRIVLFIFLVSSLVTGSVNAGETWYVSTTLNGMAGSYSGSVERSNLLSGSLLLNAEHLDNYSFAFAYNNFRIKFKDTGFGGIEINQNVFAGRFQYHFYSDALGGRITTQLVVHKISNNAEITFTDNVSVIAPKIAYLNFAKDLYLDLEYVKSDYPNNDNLSIQQITPSIGFGFNQNSDWLRLKVYLINSSDKDLSQGEESLTSVAIKWKHWLAPGAMLGINNFFIDVLAGQRIYAVDNDAFTVYNLADVQQGSAMLGIGWHPGQDMDITAIAGVEKYENKAISGDVYSQPYMYLSLTQHW